MPTSSKVRTPKNQGEFIYKEMSSPFTFTQKNSQKAALLIHGFLASPYIMRSLADVLHQNGYTVEVICLQGHGSKPEALDTVSTKVWQRNVHTALKALQKTHQEVIIVGFSLGAILGLMAAFKYKVQKLILISPAFQITFSGKILKWLSYAGLDKFLPSLFCTQSQIINLGSYTRFPAHSVAEVQKTIDQYHQSLDMQKTKTLPHIYVAASMDDATVQFKGILKSLKIFKKGSRFRIYTSDPSRLPEYLGGNDIRIIDVTDFKRILAFSHVSIPVAPTDPYFGEAGSYYGKLSKDIEFAEPTWRDKRKPIKRLTYNPDFKAMSDDIISWLKGL